MKNLLLTILIIAGLTACNNTPDNASSQERNIQLLTDSSAYHNDLLTDTSATVKSEVVPKSVEEKPVVKKKITSSKKTEAVAPVVSAPSHIPNTTPPVAEAHQDSVINNTGTANTGTIDNSGTSATSSEPEMQKKKGWNKATQGAVIGGAAGAVGGAIISKKKGVGAVVGGIIGAAGGYIIGNSKDKKDKQSEEQ